jgi:mRNA interferase MazF
LDSSPACVEERVSDLIVKKGEIYFADLSPVIGSEQGGIRPVLVVQNDVGNKYSPTVIVAAVTSQINKAKLPTHVEISAEGHGLTKDSVILLEQLRTIDKKRLRERIGRIDDSSIERTNEALTISLGIVDF